MTEPLSFTRTNHVPTIEAMIDTPPRASGKIRAFAKSVRKSEPRNITATVVTA